MNPMTEKETIKYGLDGLLEIFHNNGELKYRGNYKIGKRDGPWEWFHENGQPKKKETTITERETVSGSGSIKTVN
jgi:antitoxin component YwqK of YwqJK toxin-antitoxin module